VEYPRLSGTIIPLRQQLKIEKIPPTSGPFSLEGDSGACIVTDEGIIVGMLVGGNDQFSCATPIHKIVEHFGLSL
jgi:hypothetical protein